MASASGDAGTRSRSSEFGQGRAVAGGEKAAEKGLGNVCVEAAGTGQPFGKLEELIEVTVGLGKDG